MYIAKLSDSVTRPADTTQYAAGDVLSNVAGKILTFTGVPQFATAGDNPAGEGAALQSAVCISSANQSTKPDLELILFDSLPEPGSGVFEDNAAFDPTDASMNACIGIVDFAQASWFAGHTTSGAGGSSACAVSVNIPVLSDTIYGVLVERATYTPVSAEVFTVRLFFIR